MKYSIFAGLVLAGASIFTSSITVAEEVKSLRGSSDIEAPSNAVEINKNINDKGIIVRDFVQQPPLIPHKIKGYKINLKFNKCLTCHSWANYQRYGATKVPQSHFLGRDDEALSNVSPRRYFCRQCHVPQADAKPLVENSFKSVSTLK